jgi:hypothetical protein
MPKPILAEPEDHPPEPEDHPSEPMEFDDYIEALLLLYIEKSQA